MKNLLYGAFTTLVMFGLGKAIYERGKKDAADEAKLYAKFVELGMNIEKENSKSKDESK